MRSKVLSNYLAPFAALTNRHALSNVYKTLVLSPTGIRGCAPWGILEADVDLTGAGIEKEIWVDAQHLISVVKTLPADDVTFTVANNAINYECGIRKGNLALVAEVDIPTADWKVLNKKGVLRPDKTFAPSIELGSLSTGPQSMASAGVFGVSFDKTEEGFFVTTSDNVTMSMCLVAETDAVPENWPDRLTLAPEAAAMLVTILDQRSDKKPAYLDMSAKAVFAEANSFRLMVTPAPLMKQNILKMCLDFLSADFMVEVPTETINKFVICVGGLAESKQHAQVTLSVDKDGLKLSFEEGANNTEDTYKLAKLKLDREFAPVRLDAGRMARVLAHAHHIALDHLDKNVLAFVNDKTNFSYLISGAQVTPKE